MTHDDSRFTRLPAGTPSVGDSRFTRLPREHPVDRKIRKEQEYKPPGRRPGKGERVHELHPDGRSGEVFAVLCEPRMSNRRAEQYLFVVRWWIPWKRRSSWSVHTPFEWNVGLIRPGRRPARRARKYRAVELPRKHA